MLLVCTAQSRSITYSLAETLTNWNIFLKSQMRPMPTATTETHRTAHTRCKLHTQRHSTSRARTVRRQRPTMWSIAITPARLDRVSSYQISTVCLSYARCDCPCNRPPPISQFVSFEHHTEHPPPLPSSLPPAQQMRYSTTAYRTSTAATPNTYNNNDNNTMGGQMPQATVRTTTWHQNYSNGNSALNAAMLTNNNFLNNERAASAASSG